jgi:hypothetical protein
MLCCLKRIARSLLSNEMAENGACKLGAPIESCGRRSRLQIAERQLVPPRHLLWHFRILNGSDDIGGGGLGLEGSMNESAVWFQSPLNAISSASLSISDTPSLG